MSPQKCKVGHSKAFKRRTPNPTEARTAEPPPSWPPQQPEASSGKSQPTRNKLGPIETPIVSGKAMNPFRSSSTLQTHAHHASFWSARAPAVAFHHVRKRNSSRYRPQPQETGIIFNITPLLRPKRLTRRHNRWNRLPTVWAIDLKIPINRND